jgi:hypothetical protein
MQDLYVALENIRVGQSCPGSPIFDPLLDSLLAEFGGGSRSNCGSRSPNRKPPGAKNGQL